MDQPNQQDQNIIASQPPETSENEGLGETPADGAANSSGIIEHEFTASPELMSISSDTPGKPTLSEHIETHAGAIDTQLAALAEKKAALGNPNDNSAPAIRAVQTAQCTAIDREIARLQIEKDRVLSLLSELPAEIHALEARFFAAVKHLF